jgi:ribosomal protein S18 acetylase RimI-like enzyme
MMSLPPDHTSSLEVIQASAQHVDLIAPLFDAYRQFYQQPSDPIRARDFLAQRLAQRESVIFLASLRHGQTHMPVGFTQLYPSFSSISMRPIWILYDLFVLPEARQHGVGRALLEAARHHAEHTHAAEMTLQTAVDNRAAQALYESLGWKRDEAYLTYVLLI